MADTVIEVYLVLSDSSSSFGDIEKFISNLYISDCRKLFYDEMFLNFFRVYMLYIISRDN